MQSVWKIAYHIRLWVAPWRLLSVSVAVGCLSNIVLLMHSCGILHEGRGPGPTVVILAPFSCPRWASSHWTEPLRYIIEMMLSAGSLVRPGGTLGMLGMLDVLDMTCMF